jgi:hypothetical protein
METNFKKLKYRFLLPGALNISRYIFGNRNLNTNFISPNNPFFIIGSGRNGSTLLASILNNHPEIFLPPEQYILPYAIMQWHLLRNIAWEDYVKKVIAELLKRNKTQNWHLDEITIEEIKSAAVNLNNQHRNAVNLFHIIFTFYGQSIKSHFTRYGDHSPLNTQFFKLISDEFSTSQYIFLIRDARDVILSYSKLTNNPASDPVFASWKWNDSIKAYHYLKEKYPDRVIMVKYEDFVNSPFQETKKIVGFLNLSVIENILDFDRNEGMRKLGASGIHYHLNLSRPINKDSVGRWKTDLPKSTLNRVYPKIKHNLKKFGYD